MTSPPSKRPDLAQGEELDPTEALGAEVERQIGDLVPQKARKEIVSRMTTLVLSETFSGPIAHPRHLREYEAICPGAADRIISMAEKRNEHHISMQHNVLDAETRDRARGMYFGAALFAALVLSALWVALVKGDPILTGIFLGAAALGAIPLFIKGRNGK